MNEKDIELEMQRIYTERGGVEYPTPREFDLLREEATENLSQNGGDKLGLTQIT